MLSTALHYAIDLRRPVLPLWPRSKEPIPRRGVLDATTDEKQIRAWWTAQPEANVALATGQGLIAIDIDENKGGGESMRALVKIHGPLPRTVEQKTPNGRHLLFTCTAELPSTVGRIGQGIDSRCKAGYIVASPSVREAGVYRWKRGHEPGRIELAELPAWIGEALSAGGACRCAVHLGPPHSTGATKGSPDKPHTSPRRGPVDVSASGLDARRAIALVQQGADDGAIARALWTSAQRKKDPHSYIDATIAHARRWHDRNVTHCRVVRAWLDHLDGAPGILPPLDRLVLWCRPLDDAAARRLPYGYHAATVKIGSRAHEALDEMDAPQLVGRLVDVALDGHRVKWIGLPRPPAAVSTPSPSRSSP